MNFIKTLFSNSSSVSSTRVIFVFVTFNVVAMAWYGLYYRVDLASLAILLGTILTIISLLKGHKSTVETKTPTEPQNFKGEFSK